MNKRKYHNIVSISLWKVLGLLLFSCIIILIVIFTVTKQQTNIVVDSDYETGSAGKIVQKAPYVFEIYPLPEPWESPVEGVSTEYAFSVRVRSYETQLTSITLKFHITKTHGRLYVAPPYWISVDNENWHMINPYRIIHKPLEYVLMAIDIPSGGVAFIANQPFIPPERCIEYIRELSQGSSYFSLHEIGRTAENRPILALQTPPKKRVFVVAATMQAAEPAATTVLAVAKWLTGNDSLTTKLREEFQFAFIPLPNPDGTAHGYSLINAQGKAPMLSFHEATSGRGTSEALALWQYMETLKPEVYIEFHTHFQGNRSHKLVEPSIEWYPEASYAVYKNLENRLLATGPDMRFQTYDRNNELSLHLNFVNLANAFNTYAYAYQIYNPSIEGTHQHAVQVVKEIAEILLEK